MMGLLSLNRYVMAEIVIVAVTLTVGAGLLVSSIFTAYVCCRRYHRHRLRTNQRLSKHRQEEDYLHSVIINQHIARHLRPQSSISFISNNYHHDMTLMAPPRRLALLEQQQQQQPKREPATLVIENPLNSLSTVNTIDGQSHSSYIYENPSLELGELTTVNSVRV